MRPRRGAVVTRALGAGVPRGLPGARGARDAGRSASPCRGSARTSSRACRRSSTTMVVLADGADVDAFFRANAAFHATFVEASGNAMLQETMSRLLGQMGRYRMRSVALRGSLRRSTVEHKAILRAVRAGDVERAVRLLGEHIRIPQRRLEARARRGGRRPQCQLTRGHAARVRRQPEQPRAADRARLRPQDAARPLDGGRGARLRLRLGRRQPLLEAALGADLAALGDLAAHLARQARHGLHGLVDAQPALPRARVGDARRDLGRPHDPRHRHGQPRGGRAARVRGARPRLRAARGAIFDEGLAVDPPALDEGQRHLPRRALHLRRRRRSTRAPRWGR